MTKFVKRATFGLLGPAVALSIGLAAPALAQEQLSIGTGGTGGVYYPMGGGLAEIINTHIDGYSATTEVTGASVENMGLIATGDADLTIGLADPVAQAYSGMGRFEGQQLPMPQGFPVGHRSRGSRHLLVMSPDPKLERMSGWTPAKD